MRWDFWRPRKTAGIRGDFRDFTTFVGYLLCIRVEFATLYFSQSYDETYVLSSSVILREALQGRRENGFHVNFSAAELEYSLQFRVG